MTKFSVEVKAGQKVKTLAQGNPEEIFSAIAHGILAMANKHPEMKPLVLLFAQYLTEEVLKDDSERRPS